MEDCINCDSCYEMDWIACYGILTIEAGLTPATDYTIFIKDRHGNYYSQAVTTDGDGAFTIDLTQYDERIFHKNSGCWTVSASLNPLVNEPEIMIIGYTEYTCAKITFNDYA